MIVLSWKYFWHTDSVIRAPAATDTIRVAPIAHLCSSINDGSTTRPEQRAGNTRGLSCPSRLCLLVFATNPRAPIQPPPPIPTSDPSVPPTQPLFHDSFNICPHPHIQCICWHRGNGDFFSHPYSICHEAKVWWLPFPVISPLFDSCWLYWIT